MTITDLHVSFTFSVLMSGMDKILKSSCRELVKKMTSEIKFLTLRLYGCKTLMLTKLEKVP